MLNGWHSYWYRRAEINYQEMLEDTKELRLASADIQSVCSSDEGEEDGKTICIVLDKINRISVDKQNWTLISYFISNFSVKSILYRQS